MQHFFLLLLAIFLQPPPDTIGIPAVVTSSRNTVQLENVASPVSYLGGAVLAREGVKSTKGITGLVPNLYMPDYGASLTSSIYHRGFGSRIDNPVIGIYIDDIPVLEKNACEFEMLDISAVRMLRGSQGTLYGRNSMSGVLDIRTMAPSLHRGWRGEFSSGSALTTIARISHYRPGHAFVLGARHSNGFYVNDFNGKLIDRHDGLSGRHRFEKRLSDTYFFENIASASFLSEGGFAYSRLVDGKLMPPSFNDENSYRRLQIMEGAKLTRTGDRWRLRSAASLQLLADHMRMDQDFTPEPVFTLGQKQKIAAATFETSLRPMTHPEWHDHTTAAFFFYKINRMNAPVNFLETGTRRLILDNANRNIPESIGWLDFEEYEFPIFSDFTIQTWNAAVYHESVFTPGRWVISAGLRLDYEGGLMDYDSRASVNYRFHPIMPAAKEYRTVFRGRERNHSLELLPKLSVLYDLRFRNGAVKFFASFAKGHKAGGFNTQIFSDILQSMMMNGLMDDLGVHLDKETVSPGSGNTRYKPEEAYTFESGFRFRLFGRLSGAASVFAIDCRNQQLTVFPAGQSTGRMMTNAGRSYSLGYEGELAWECGALSLRAAYGYNKARFAEYNDGNNDYAGNILPYAPSSTLSVSSNYRLELGGRQFRALEGGIQVHRTGKIWWDDANTLSQDPCITLGAHLSLFLPKFEIFARGENLTDARYNTFYFKSVGNEFFQIAKPRRISAGISFEL